MHKIFLQKNNSCFSNNVENKLNVDFSTKIRLLPNNDLSKEFSLNTQYNKERDNCDRFRLIIGINPICSNILFNSKTEIIIDEGSFNPSIVCDCNSANTNNILIKKSTHAKNATNSTETITYLDAIRNTEYSHPELGNFTYHCGFDIFNNHMLRNKGYIHVNKLNTSYSNDSNVYNTIEDFSRDKIGNIIEQNINTEYRKDNFNTQMHLYRFDSILTMKDAFLERCKERDGWWGFVNPTNINIPNREDESILTNRLLNNRDACDFIDLYPDRSLYSFNPKYNKFKNRLEKNWDYCITYPFKNDYEKINEVCGGENSSIRVNFIKKSNPSGVEILECHSYFKHNLKFGDYINLYYKDGNNFQCYVKPLKIESIGDGTGDNNEKIFNIKYSDISSLINFIKKDDNEKTIYDGHFFYKKNVNGNECQYYFRKFKKLKNIDGSDLRNDINKIAFGKNIYGDDMSQIIFTDDININSLVDNNNRPLSKIYFTVIKRNAGHDIWYRDYKNSNSDKDKGSDAVEYSHCFGKVTSGLDFSGMKEEPFDYNIHRLHNLDFKDNIETAFNIDKNQIEIINYNENTAEVELKVWEGKTFEVIKINISNSLLSEIRTFLMWGESVLKIPKTINDNVMIGNNGQTIINNDNKGITINDDEFYGDVVEYDNTNCKETIISNVYHRVNTAQRECFDSCFKNIYQDKIVHDDYDIGIVNGAQNFKVSTYYLNDVINSDTEKKNSYEYDTNLVFANIMPEGSFYNPHTQIDLKEEDGIISNAPAKLINYNSEDIIIGIENDKEVLIINVPTNYGFYKGDYIAFYDINTNNTIWGEIIKTENNGFTLYINIDIDIDLNDFKYKSRKYKAYWSPNNVPIYANFLPKNRKFVWRKLLGQSELKNTSPLYDMTFSNGRLYVEKNINFFLRRQDPFGNYGLSKPITSTIGKQYTNPSDDFSIPGDKQIDFTGVLYSNNNYDNCY